MIRARSVRQGLPARQRLCSRQGLLHRQQVPDYADRRFREHCSTTDLKACALHDQRPAPRRTHKKTASADAVFAIKQFVNQR